MPLTKILLIIRSEFDGVVEPAADSLFEELGLDSLDLIALVTEVEQAFDIRIPNSALGSMEKISDLAAVVVSELRKKDGSNA